MMKMAHSRALAKLLLLTGVACLIVPQPRGAFAQSPIQITEIMSNPLSAGDDAWEWIEVRNTGGTPIDLNGYIIDRINDAETSSIGIDGARTTNTIIPAGGIAVLYDADVSVSAADFNEPLFRTAWGLALTVPLIGVSGGFGGGLTNSGGTAIGFWPDFATYELDLADDGMGTLRVNQFTNAAFNVDFRTSNGFPGVGDGVSIAWNGVGSYQDGANWAATAAGATSVPATVASTTNSPLDVGNPGLVPGGTPPTGLLFTEIMYNPRSTEPDWEWVEVYNNTGATIDFSVTPYVFDDNANADFEAPNLTSGVIPNGTAAVLFNADPTNGITISDMQAAWDPGGVRGTNFIPLNESTAYNQGGDVLAIWPSFDAYQDDTAVGEGSRTTNSAIAVGTYNDEQGEFEGVTGIWPSDNGDASIYLFDLSLDRTVGENWEASTDGDAIGSFNAVGLSGTITIHPGGDLGTPGVIGDVPPPLDNADFNDDGKVDGNDFLAWQRGLGVGTTLAQGDADSDGDVDGADLTIWRTQFGPGAGVASAAAVPEPGSLAIAASALGILSYGRRRR
jgi:hypothetical protein